jgi:hypothetical protein
MSIRVSLRALAISRLRHDLLRASINVRRARLELRRD